MRFVLFLPLALLWVAPLSAQTITYSNVTNFQAAAYAPGAGTSGLEGANRVATLIADDIQLDTSITGYTVISGFQFTVANLNAVAVTARPLVRFWSDNNLDFIPDTFIGGFNFNPITFAAGPGVQLFTFNPGTALFTAPGDGFFWAGLTFDDNNGTTGITAAQIENLGQGLFDPPTIGSSLDLFFETAAPGSFVGNNPAGGLFFFGGAPNPIANFGWQFSVIPEPTTWALLGLGSISAVPLYRRWRQARQAQANAQRLFSKK